MIGKRKGTLIDSLSLSIGSASSTEIEEFSLNRLNDLINIVDKKMYVDKALFYKTKGIERRR